MALQTEAQWKTFFISAGIADDASTTYAKLFFDNGFNKNSLSGLDKDTLAEVGITLLGHKLAIIKCANQLQQSTPSTPPTTVAKASVTAHLSTLTLEMTKVQFRKFQQDWLVYKQLTNLQPAQASAHLYNACNEEVQMSIINTHPDFSQFDEKKALEIIEPIVTVNSNPAVHRKAFVELLQTENQSVKNFVVRLRSAASDCAFECPSCKFDLSAMNIKDQFTRGLNNTTLQAEIFAKTNQLKTLEDIVGYAESFETALRDQSTLASTNNQTETAYKFSHRKKKQQQQQQQQQQQLQQQQPCNGCGGEPHHRPTQCKAWGKDCNNCGVTNHFASVCRQKGPLKGASAQG